MEPMSAGAGALVARSPIPYGVISGLYVLMNSRNRDTWSMSLPLEADAVRRRALHDRQIREHLRRRVVLEDHVERHRRAHDVRLERAPPLAAPASHAARTSCCAAFGVIVDAEWKLIAASRPRLPCRRERCVSSTATSSPGDRTRPERRTRPAIAALIPAFGHRDAVQRDRREVRARDRVRADAGRDSSSTRDSR